jgi:hypothetical protein
MEPSRSATFAALAAAALALTACHRDLSCTTEVTEGKGTFKGTVSGARSEVDLRRESVRVACGQLCAMGGKNEGCVSRCAVDAEAGKIGARTTCTKEGAAR